ncbi:MAG: hypothetical protein CMG07_05350 [Candidatus Marinimicrobia bacterium]|nr:hypothetical protein [Candidatus Neomarinimicrobiota bacterium]|tara:strand:+ start:1803 stop:2321 length:519 start_codon:yes stop_codon:yes gene_type:complete
MIHTAEFNGLGLIIFLIWFIASSLLQKNKKNKKNSIEPDDLDENSNPFSMQDLRSLFDNSLNKLKTDNNLVIEPEDNYNFITEKSDNDNIIESIDRNDLKQNEDEIETDISGLNRLGKKIQNNFKSDDNFIISKKNKISINKSLNKVFQNKNELRRAILLKEILDKPKALRK